MQSDGGLVEHVACADQPRAQTCGKLDALRFAAGERGREPVERQIIQPDIVQELQALPDLHQDLVGDRALLRAPAPARRRTRNASAMFMLRHVGQVLAADPHVESFLAQPRALALGALRIAAIAAQEDAHVQLVLLRLEVVEELAD